MKCAICAESGSTKRLYRLPSFHVLRCRNCGLLSTDLDLDDEAVKQLYGQDYFEERSEYFFDNDVIDEDHGHHHDSVDDFQSGLNHIRNLAPNAQRLLDVGCGVGVFMLLARSAGYEVAGVDISHFATERARKTHGLDVRTGQLHDVGFEEASFDVVTMWDVLEHVTDPLAALKNARRLLRKDGLLFVVTPNGGALLRSIAHCLYRGSLGLFRYPVKKLYHCYHLFYFDQANLRSLAQQAGFSVELLEGKSIALTKARGSRLEKKLVGAIATIERLVGREYELFMVARRTDEQPLEQSSDAGSLDVSTNDG